MVRFICLIIRVVMLYGWVVQTTDASGNNAYKQINLDDDNHTKQAVSEFAGDAYYCGDEDDGHAKKNKWYKIGDRKIR